MRHFWTIFSFFGVIGKHHAERECMIYGHSRFMLHLKALHIRLIWLQISLGVDLFFFNTLPPDLREI